MNKNITERFETKLETAEQNNIVAILDAKLEATSPERVVDYVSFGIDNLTSRIARMKEAKKELDELIKLDEAQVDTIKHGASEWLSETGIDSLKGDRVSSMKITTPKAKEDLVVTDELALINKGYFKTVLDKTAVKKAIQDGIEVDGANIEVTHQSETLTVYKKRNVIKS